MASISIAKELSLSKKYGLETQSILMPRSPLAVLAALMAGEIDMAVIGPGHLVNADAGSRHDQRRQSCPEARLPTKHQTGNQKEEEELYVRSRIAMSGSRINVSSRRVAGPAKLGARSESAKLTFLTIPEQDQPPA